MEVQVILFNVFLVAKHLVVKHLTNFNRKITYYREIGWLIQMIEKVKKKGWKGLELRYIWGSMYQKQVNCLYRFHSGTNEIQTLFFPSINIQSAGRLESSSDYPASGKFLCFGKREAPWFTASPGLHTLREKWGPQKKFGVPLLLEKGKWTKTINAYYRMWKAWRWMI